MPTIEIIDGIRIMIHSREHRPPHIHASYNEFEVAVEIESGKIIAGDFPVRQKAKIKEWLNKNRQWAKNVFFNINPGLQ